MADRKSDICNKDTKPRKKLKDHQPLQAHLLISCTRKDTVFQTLSDQFIGLPYAEEPPNNPPPEAA